MAPPLWMMPLADLGVNGRIVNRILRHMNARFDTHWVKQAVLVGQVTMLSASRLASLGGLGSGSIARLILAVREASQQAQPTVDVELEARRVAHLVLETDTGHTNVTRTRHYFCGGPRDIDEPVGFCLITPLDRLRQLAENCRREGRVADQQVYEGAAIQLAARPFTPERWFPSGVPQKAEDASI